MTSNVHTSGAFGEPFAPQLEEEALNFIGDLVSSGSTIDEALRNAVAAYPAHAGLLADYVLLTYEPADKRSPDAFSDASVPDDPLADIVMSAAYRRAPHAGAISGIAARMKSIGLARDAACSRLHIGASVLTKLERGLILVDTIPARFLRELAAALRATEEAVSLALSSGPRLSAAAEHNASHPPQVGRAQSFSEAVAASVGADNLDETARTYWAAERLQ